MPVSIVKVLQFNTLDASQIEAARTQKTGVGYMSVLQGVSFEWAYIRTIPMSPTRRRATFIRVNAREDADHIRIYRPNGEGRYYGTAFPLPKRAGTAAPKRHSCPECSSPNVAGMMSAFLAPLNTHGEPYHLGKHAEKGSKLTAERRCESCGHTWSVL